jgi:hypothetical protein
VNNYAFKISIDTLVRESVQNVNDQRIRDAAEVEFVLEEVSGPALKRLLELIGWNQGLKDHLLAISKGESHLRARSERALAAVKKGVVRTLVIRDLDCRGLEGEEDGRSGNFAMLCRNELVTDTESKKLKGGAFGIGKSVLWAYSDASTVVFSSLPLDRASSTRRESIGEARFFGRSYLVSHEFGSKRLWHNGDGTFGDTVVENGEIWVKSIRGSAARTQVKASILDRDWRRTGTSILIPFLDNPRIEREPSLMEVVSEIEAAIQLWFWPALEDGLLKAKVGIRTSAGERLETIESPDWAKLFLRSESDGAGRTKIDEQAKSASLSLSVDVPERAEEPLLKRAAANAAVSLTRVESVEEVILPERVRNSIALVRGARMVVEYQTRSSYGYLPSFVGFVRAGNWRGSTSSDNALEALLRDSEPPAHDKWDANAEKLGLNYKSGAKTAVKGFLDAIEESVRGVLGTSKGSSNNVPRGLADRLRGKRKTSGEDKRTEKFAVLEKVLDRSIPSELTARATVKRMKGSKPWRVIASATLVDEQATPRKVAHDDSRFAVVPSSLKVDRDYDEFGVLRAYIIYAPSAVEKIEFTLVGLFDKSIVARRAMADLRAIPSEIK